MYASRVKVLTISLGRAWRLGAGPPKGGVTIDLDSTICEVSGKAKQGAGFGYTHKWGYHPLFAGPSIDYPRRAAKHQVANQTPPS